MRSKQAFTVVEIIIVGVIVMLLAAIAIPAFDKVAHYNRDQQAEYEVWQKLNPQKPISFDEWKVAKKAGYLSATTPH